MESHCPTQDQSRTKFPLTTNTCSSALRPGDIKDAGPSYPIPADQAAQPKLSMGVRKVQGRPWVSLPTTIHSSMLG